MLNLSLFPGARVVSFARARAEVTFDSAEVGLIGLVKPPAVYVNIKKQWQITSDLLLRFLGNQIYVTELR